MVDFDDKCQRPKKSQSSGLAAKKIICNQPSMRTFLQSLQMFLDEVDLGGESSIYRVT